MREKIKDHGRLEHIFAAINVLLKNKDKYRFDDIVELKPFIARYIEETDHGNDTERQ